MANQKITDLTALTAVDSGDVLPIVDDPAGTPITKKITVANLVPSGINGLLFKALSADATGSNVNTAQPWFPTNGGVTVAASTSYFFQGWFWSTRSAGSTSHTTNILFAGTATLTDITWFSNVKTGDAQTIAATNTTGANVATSTNIKAASTSTTENIMFEVQGVVRINGGGTFIPQFIYSSAPGQAPTIKEGTYFMMWPIGDNTVTERGTWS